jgi:predicted HAD superfamily Cof-like phosphohydrolase
MRDIHVKFDTPAPDEPVLMSPNAVNRRAEWIQEEVDELLEAETIEEQTDAWIDIIVFAVGGLVEQGVVPGPIMSIVLKSQYDKLWEDGQPRFRADGKWIKPPTWTDPKPLIEAEIKRQIDEN